MEAEIGIRDYISRYLRYRLIDLVAAWELYCDCMID